MSECSYRLSAYIDGELSPTERRAVEEHLASCEVCAEMVSELKETGATLSRAGGGLLLHVDLARAWELVSNGSRAVMGRPTAGAHPGAAADFVAIAADTVGEAIAEASADRIVIHRGRVVARTAVRQTLGVAVGEEVLQ